MIHRNTEIKEWEAMRRADRTERALTALVIMSLAIAGAVGILTLVRGLLQPLAQVLGGAQ